MYLRDNTIAIHLCELQVEAVSKKFMSKVYSIHSCNHEVFMAEKNTTVRTINSKVLIVWYMVFKVYTKARWLKDIASTDNSVRSNLLIQMQLILAFKVQIVRAFLCYNIYPSMWGIVGYVAKIDGK